MLRFPLFAPSSWVHHAARLYRAIYTIPRTLTFSSCALCSQWGGAVGASSKGRIDAFAQEWIDVSIRGEIDISRGDCHFREDIDVSSFDVGSSPSPPLPAPFPP